MKKNKLDLIVANANLLKSKSCVRPTFFFHHYTANIKGMFGSLFLKERV